MISTKSKKWTVALVLIGACLGAVFGIISQSVSESSQLNADGAVPTKILGIVATDEYTLADGYWRKTNGDGTYGDYAFYQGMSVEDALARIKGVKVKLDNDTEDVLPIGDPATNASFTYKVTVTTTATSTGNNSADNVAVPFTAEVVVDEAAPLTSDCEVNFIAVKPYVLEWVAPLSTVGKGLTTDMDITSNLDVLGLQDAQVRFRLTNGNQGETILTQYLKTEDTLTPSGEKMKTLKEGDKYTKDISIYYAPRIDGQQTIDRSIQPLKFTVEDIAYAYPTGVGKIISSNTAQMAGSPFNFEGYKLNIEYRNGRYTSEEFLTALDCVTNITFYDSRDAELGHGKEFHLTTAVRSAYIEYAIQGKNGLLTGGSYVNFSVNQQPISQPTVSDLNPTYKDGGVTVTIGAIEKDDVGTVTYKLNTTDTSAAVLAEDNSSITFYKGGTYILSIILERGADGDYLWNTGVADRKGNYQIDYTITVSNAPVDVTLTYTGANGANREYGDDEPNRTVALSYAGGGSQISGGLTQGSAADNPNDTDEPEYELRYYGGGLTLDQTDSVTGQAYTTKRPTALGTSYYVYAATGATDKYAAGRSTPVQFTISHRIITLSENQTKAEFNGKDHALSDFIDLNSNAGMLANDDKLADVMSFTNKPAEMIHAGDYSVTISFNDTAKGSNYTWSKDDAVTRDKSFTFKITPITLNLSVSQDDHFYGQQKKTISVNDSGLSTWVDGVQKQWVKIGAITYTNTDTNVVYDYDAADPTKDGSTWPAGNYTVSYTTANNTELNGIAGRDYVLPSANDTFVINKAKVTPVGFGGLSSGTIGEYNPDSSYVLTVNKWTDALIDALYGNSATVTADILDLVVSYTGITVDTSGTTLADAFTVVGNNATVSMQNAGQYTVTVTLKDTANYEWSVAQTDDKIEFVGNITRKSVGLPSVPSQIVYNAQLQTVTLTQQGAAWGLENIANITTVKGKTLAAKGQNGENINNADGSFKVKNAGLYDITVEFVSDNVANNYCWIIDGSENIAPYVVSYEVQQAPLKVVWDGKYTDGAIPAYPFIEESTNQTRPAYAPNVYAADNGNIHVKTYAIYTKADYSGTSVTEITAAGDYYIRIVTIEGVADDKVTYLNYYVPQYGEDGFDNVSIRFSVESTGLNKVVLNDGSESVSVVYKGSDYDFSAYVKDWTNYVLDETAKRYKVTITIVSDTTHESAALKNVDTYTITVKPAANYKWKTGSEEGAANSEQEELRFTFAITKLAVAIKWQNVSKDYGDAATTTVEVANRGTDDVNVTYVYQKDGVEYTADTIKNADAGVYTLVEKTLTGTDKDNYTLTGCTYTNGKNYTVYKKGIVKPMTDKTAANAVGTYGDGKTVALYSNSLQTGLFSVAVSGKYPAEWFDDTESDKIFTVDASVFDKDTGNFTYVNAGYYTFTFTIDDTENYCWSDEYNAQKSNFGAKDYKQIWNNLIVVNRKPIVAPALGEYRAMEWDKGVAVLNKVVFTGKKDGVDYSTQYAAFISVGNYDIFSDEQAGGTGDKANITPGKYVARLTVTGDHANDYEWEFDTNDKIGNYVDAPGYEKVNAQKGAIIYLFYTITASQLPVSYEVVNTVGGYAYVFGQNGYAIGNTVIDEDDRVTPTNVLSMTGTDGDIAIAKLGTISYTFTAHADNPDLQVVDVNKLPWYAGKYNVTIKIDFTGTAYADVYSELNISRDKDGNALVLVVAPREIEVKWTNGGNANLTVDSKTITKTYNGNGELPTAIVTNMPSKYALDDTSEDLPALTLNLTENDVINASTGYTLTATLGENEKNFVDCDASARQATLVVNKAALNISGVGTKHVYGDSLDYLNGDNYKTYYATDGTIYDRDGKVIKITVTDGTNVITSNLGAVVTGTYYVVPTLDATVSGSANYELNFAGNGEGNKFTVEKRQISVAVDYKSATSVYGTTPININVTPSIYTVTVHNGLKASGLPAGVSASDVFTFAVKDGSNAIDNLTDVGMYDITCALTDAASANYELNYYAGLDLPQYEITKANITAIKVTPYTGVYNADYHNILSTNTASVVNDSLSQNALVWQWSTNGTTWNEYTVNDGVASERVRDVNDSKPYYIKVSAGKNFVESDSITVNVAISKAPLTVSVNMTIHFGEHGPDKMGNPVGGVTYWYNQSITALRKSGGIYTVEGLLKDDRTLFYDLSDDFYSLNSNLFSYSYKSGEEYTRGKDVGTYTLVFDPNGLECGNYTFAGKDGALTVERLPVTVTLVEDVMTAVYGTHPELLAVNSKYIESVTTQEKSFYNNSNTIDLDGMVLSDFILSIRTTALDDSNTLVITQDVGKYPIIVTLVNKNCYWETAAPDTQYEITQATNVITTEDYELFVTQGLSTTDSGNVPTAWTYGDFVNGVHTNGYAPNGRHALNTLALLYSGSPLKITITRGSGDSAVSISDTAFDPANGSNSATNVLKALFDQMHAAKDNTGLYAGDYVVTYEMEDSTNYIPFSETWYFKVAKQNLNITPANLSVMYGEDLTTATVTDANREGIIAATSSNLYPYFVSGLVAHNGDGTLDLLSNVVAITLSSDYSAGFENGSRKEGGYAITVTGTEAALYENYEVSYGENSAVTVTPRPITIQIDSTLSNAFNLYTYENGLYVTETAKTYRFTLTDGTFAAGDYTTEVVKDGNSVEYTVQSVFTLASAAFDNSAEDLGASYNTNHAGKYPVYMLKGDHYGDDGANYSITITDTQYVGNENITTVPADAISDTYGTFTINKAKLNLTFVGPYVDSSSGDLYGNKIERGIYDGHRKVFSVDQSGSVTVPVTIKYYEGTGESKTLLGAGDENAPKNVGTYTIECVVDNKDYEAASSTTTHIINAKSIGINVDKLMDATFQGKDLENTVKFDGCVGNEVLKVSNIQVDVQLKTTANVSEDIKNRLKKCDVTVSDNGLQIVVRNAGSYKVTVQMADDEESGFVASNYAFTGSSGKFEISNNGSAVTFSIDIAQANLTVQVQSSSIQYGTDNADIAHGIRLDVNGNVLFYGFVLEYQMRLAGSGYETNEAALKIIEDEGDFFVTSGVTYTTSNTGNHNAYSKNDIVGTNYNVTPAGLVAYNFNVTYGSSGMLTVVKRDLHIKISGYGDGNGNATTTYIGQIDPLYNVDVVAKGYLDVASGYNLVNGNKLADLGITLSVDGEVDISTGNKKYNAREDAYTVSYSVAENEVNRNYNITFVKADGRTVIDNTNKPTYLITKALLTIRPLAQSVIYGNSVNVYLTDGIDHSGTNADILKLIDLDGAGFVNSETYAQIVRVGQIEGSHTFRFTTAYAPYTSHVGDSITISLEGSVLEFTNYKVTLATADITVTPRTISAQVTNVAYEETGAEIYSEDGSDYHGGIYGKAHEATIAFSGHGNDAYMPTAVLTYKTVTNSAYGQQAGAAPTRVGEYPVTVTLNHNDNGADKYDYVFADNAKAVELGFKVVQQRLNASWKEASINSSPEAGTADLNNTVTGYVHAIMFVSRFDKNIGGTSTSLSPWTDGDKTDKYIADGEGLRILASNQGTYTVVLELRATAQHNYCWDGDTADKTCVFYVTTSKVTIYNFDWDSWTYGEDKYGPKEISVSNGNAAGVTYRFAAVPQGFTGELSELSYNMGAIPVNAGHYAAQATYPTVGSVGGDVKYSAFEIYKAPIAVPTVSGTVFTYNGATQSSDPITVAKTEEGIAIVIIQSYSQNALSCIVTENGVVISAVNAGSYDITFALASSNYTWADSNTDTNSVRTVTWTIGKANDNEITLNQLNDIGYGTPYSVTATSAYGGAIPANNVYFAKSDSKPASGSALWTTAQPTGRGTYYVKVVAQGTVNYETAERISEWSFEITKAMLTVTPTGSMVYGDAFTATSDKYSWTVTSGLVGNDKDDVVRVIGSGVTYKTVGSPTLNVNENGYGFELVADTNGFVIGLEADNYDIVSGTGTLRVTARPLTVTIGATSSEYGMPIVLDKDALLTYSETVLAGNNLNIELSTTASPAQDGTPKSVGGYVITATYNCANYDVTFVTGAYTITQRQVIVGFADGLGGEYGSVTYADDEGYDCTVTVKNGEGNYTADEIGLALTYLGLANSGHTFEGRPTEAGSYNISASCANANFAIVDTPAHQFVISKKVIDGSKLSFASIEYTGELVTPQITDDDYNVGGAAIYRVEERTDLINVNTYNIALTLKDPFNYKWASVEVATREVPFEITKATLKVTPNGTMTYGQQFNQAAFTYEVDDGDLLGQDVGKAVNSIVRANINAIEYKLVTEVSGLLTVKDGGYELTMETDGDSNVLGLEANNYNIVLSDAYGTLTVNKREIALQVIDSASVYGEDVTLSDTYRVLSGSVVDGDDLGFTPVRADASNLNQGTYTVSATIGNNNYLATEIRNGTHTIVRLKVAVSIRAQDGVYGVTPATVRVMEVVTTNATGTQHSVPVDSLTYVYSYTGVVNGSSVSETFTAMPTNAGRYTARLTALNNDNYELDTTQGILTSMFLVNAKEINADNLQINSPRYTGSAQKPQVTVPEEFRDMFYDNGVLVYEQDDREFTIVGRHTFVLTLKAEYANNYKWASSDVAARSVDFVIIKAQNGLVDDKIDVPAWVYGNVTDNPQAEAVSGGEAKVTFEYSEDGINYTDRIPTAAGDYYVRAVIEATDNYEAYTSAPKKFTIEQAEIEVLPTINVITEGIEKNDVYTGGQLVSTIDGFNTKVMDMPKVDNNDPNVIVRVSGGSVMLLAANAGTYTIRFPLLDADNYKWNEIEGATIENNEVVLRWTINKQKVAVPDREGKTFFVTGNDMTFIPEGYNPAIMTIEGNVSGYSGTFKAVISLKDPSNYEWADSDLVGSDLEIEWKIIGVNIIFVIIISVIASACITLAITAGILYARKRSKIRAEARAIDRRSKADGWTGEPEDQDSTQNDNGDEGGND